MTKLLSLAPFLLALAACYGPPSADDVQRSQQEQMSSEATRQTGMPGITNFTERRMMKKILELRDQALSTHTYVMDLQGRLWHVCDSIGYGLPYATQYTNPQYVTRWGAGTGGGYVLPQADPNGLFSPAAAEGTWVACVNESKKDYDVVYIEPRVIVTPFQLASAGEWQVR